MTFPAARYLAPRKYVPADLKSSRVGNLDESGATAIAYLVKRRTKDRSFPTRVVVVDLDRAVYACRAGSASVELLMVMHPELIVGTYDDGADAADIAADLETHRREWIS